MNKTPTGGITKGGAESVANNVVALGGPTTKSPNFKEVCMVSVFLDGNQWCALVGENLQEGVAGFGDTPSDALRDLADQIETCGWNF